MTLIVKTRRIIYTYFKRFDYAFDTTFIQISLDRSLNIDIGKSSTRRTQLSLVENARRVSQRFVQREKNCINQVQKWLKILFIKLVTFLKYTRRIFKHDFLENGAFRWTNFLFLHLDFGNTLYGRVTANLVSIKKENHDLGEHSA